MKTKQENTDTELDENRLIAERRIKLDALREAGQAFPNDFRKDTTSDELHARFGDAMLRNWQNRRDFLCGRPHDGQAGDGQNCFRQPAGSQRLDPADDSA